MKRRMMLRHDTTHGTKTYVSVDMAVKLVEQLGRGILLAKVDIRSVYRMLPIHPDDRWLLEMHWEGSVFVDTALPFGLRSAQRYLQLLPMLLSG